VLVDVVLVLDELVLHHLLEVRPLGAQARNPIHDVSAGQMPRFLSV
jgi:hypothetical protein